MRLYLSNRKIKKMQQSIEDQMELCKNIEDTGIFPKLSTTVYRVHGKSIYIGLRYATKLEPVMKMDGKPFKVVDQNSDFRKQLLDYLESK